MRLVGKIFNFLPELSERERKKQIRTKQTCPRDQNQSLQSAGGGNVDTRWQLELRLKLRLRLELVSGLLVSSVICTKIWLSIIDGGNNGNVKCTRQLLQLPAFLPANGARLAVALPATLPPPPATTRFLFENHFVCFMDLRSLKWLRRFVCLVLLLLKILRREWKVPAYLPLPAPCPAVHGQTKSSVWSGPCFCFISPC